ncbi:hypothetical protein [Geothrix sp. SG200]|uniref:glycoside hydrolase family 30 protein n=1 Tax=Geothrix sp. SG200 TaxID=2922865 RepID=UPI001FAE5FA3|nr:hypothetical protein [Geothrix sp. SG200]
MPSSRFLLLLAFGAASASLLVAGTPRPATEQPAPLGPRLAEFVQTSAAGDRFRQMPRLKFTKGSPSRGVTVTVDPSVQRQTLEGIGGGLTESSAYVLAHLAKPARGRILDRFFGPTGARFTMARTHIGACDFCLTGRYSYDDVPEDSALEHFSIAPDQRGFREARDPEYALLPLIKDALARNPGLKVVASPWTAPAWMKDNRDWYGQGRGGTLLPEHWDTFARYMVKYLQAYRAEGVPIWGVTPENEPVGNGGQWESMEFTAEGLRDYIKLHLGPQFAKHGLAGVKLIQFDHNRDANALRFSEAVLGDPSAAAFVWGTGLHWYSTTNSVRTELLDHLRASYPTKALLHTEGCIDAIGTEDSSPGGAFRGWKNEAWWWGASATDWGFYWAPPEERPAHPRYSPVHRYALDLLEGLNHGFVGWIDWNIVLDRRGGPNHVNNFCAAPIMVDTTSGETHVTPLYYVLAHFSRYLQPGDRVVRVSTSPQGPDSEGLHATAALRQDGRHLIVIAYNPTPRAIIYTLQVGILRAPVVIPGQALQSFCISMDHLRRGTMEVR